MTIISSIEYFGKCNSTHVDISLSFVELFYCFFMVTVNRLNTRFYFYFGLIVSSAIGADLKRSPYNSQFICLFYWNRFDAGVQIAYFAIIGTQLSMVVLSMIAIYGIYRVSWLIHAFHFYRLYLTNDALFIVLRIYLYYFIRRISFIAYLAHGTWCDGSEFFFSFIYVETKYILLNIYMDWHAHHSIQIVGDCLSAHM